MTVVSPSKLREDIYNLLDRVLETGDPLEVKRKGQTLLIVPERKKGRMQSIIPKKITDADDEALIHTGGEAAWKPFI